MLSFVGVQFRLVPPASKGAVNGGGLANGSVTLETSFQASSRRSRNSSYARRTSLLPGGVLIGSVGIAQAKVAHSADGFYCFSGLNPAPAGGVATIDYSESGENILIQFDTGQGPVCPAGTQAFVNTRKTTSSTKSEPTDAGFFVVLY